MPPIARAPSAPVAAPPARRSSGGALRSLREKSAAALTVARKRAATIRREAATDARADRIATIAEVPLGAAGAAFIDHYTDPIADHVPLSVPIGVGGIALGLLTGFHDAVRLGVGMASGGIYGGIRDHLPATKRG